ncbi:transducin beta-like protein 3 [Tribolium madens]|uniref:transducin beta-like protein 3 n=1 Tax=Tribolium madens TaxID=41895 RepID=UPI001CF72C29|nr:transducin beta-like protein 3 [Tribolium madens]
MTTNVKLKEAFEVESKHGAFYTGGNIEWHQDTIYCQTSSSVTLLNTQDGVVSQTIGEENGEDCDFLQTFTTDGERIISSHKSSLLKLWNRQGQLVKMWKYIHKGPIAKLSLKDKFLASGGSDGSVRIWDLDHQTCILNLKGCQGVVNVAEFHPIENVIFGSGDDGKILSWDLIKGEPLVGYNAHFSKVTSLVFANDDKHFVTSGRDKVIILWQFNQIKALKTIPLYEAVEVIIGLPEKFKLPDFKSDLDCIYVASGGENGLVRVWDVTNSKEIYQQQNSLVTKAQDGGLAITKLLLGDEGKTLAVITVDHNIILHSLKSFVCLKQFIGFSDEILDICFVGKNDSHLAVATNSCDIKLYDNSDMNCQLLKGHSDIVLTLAASRANPNFMLSGGKDNKICLWSFDGATMSCIGTGLRHTGSVGSVTFSNTNLDFMVSVSQDTCLKLWEVPKKPTSDTILNCTRTEIAHQKDINCVSVSPNDRIIATASQDKTAKLWTDSLTFVGTLKGHKRGVWSVKFSPIDQVVITSSADCTIKLWSVADLNCLKTLEGHDSSVLQAEFVSNGMQILSAGADGFLKLFSVKTSECVGTFDQHEGRIWAMAVQKDESRIVTGGSDSLLIKWKDVTEERKLQRLKEEEEEALQQQQLANYLQNDQLLKALKLALKLDRPLQVLKIVQGIIRKGETTGLAEAVKELRNDQKEALLKSAATWNTNSRNCQSAQLVLNILLGELQSGDFKPVGLSRTVEGALPYTERHFKRLTQLLQDLHFVTYTINCMQPHIKNM